MEPGLAEQLSQSSSATQAGSSDQMPTVEELVQLIMQGITPQQLIEAGIPQQLVDQAVAMAGQMAQQQGPTAGGMGQGSIPMDDQGLAAMGQGGM
jgi:hypothetical protein